MRAGEEAEKQMAFYLRRTFAKANDYYVLNDLRIVHGGSVAQIDQLQSLRHTAYLLHCEIKKLCTAPN